MKSPQIYDDAYKTVKCFKHPNGDIFLVFPDRDTGNDFVEVWSESEGHNHASLEYINEAKLTNGNSLIARYNKAYNTDL